MILRPFYSPVSRAYSSFFANSELFSVHNVQPPEEILTGTIRIPNVFQESNYVDKCRNGQSSIEPTKYGDGCDHISEKPLGPITLAMELLWPATCHPTVAGQRFEG
jgi:hypothetical protein